MTITKRLYLLVRIMNMIEDNNKDDSILFINKIRKLTGFFFTIIGEK